MFNENKVSDFKRVKYVHVHVLDILIYMLRVIQFNDVIHT